MMKPTHSPRRPQSTYCSARVAISAVGVFIALSVIPSAAQSREQRQMMADLRMLQEQSQILQNLLGTISEAITAVNTRIDAQANVAGKALADQKVVIDNLTNSVREIREKLDDNTVRLGSLSDEVDALRQGIQHLSTLRTASDPALTAPGTVPETTAPGTPESIIGVTTPIVTPPPAVPVGTSPQKLFEEARADYSIGQWDLAIAGFEAVILYFPRSERAADAQLHIGHSYVFAGNNEKAVEAYDAVIRDYPASAGVPDAYYKKGVALRALKRSDEARAAFEYAVKTYPDSAAASLARQGLAQLATQK